MILTNPIKYKNMSKILITGATGVIGHYAVNQLLTKNFEVIAASRSGKGSCGVSLDIHDLNAVNNLMQYSKPDYLLHLAWNIGEGYSNNPENFAWINSSLNLLKIFAENGGKRAVFAGSCFEYSPNYGLMIEDFTPLEPISIYGLAKSSLYKLATEYAKILNISFAWGRGFFLYGVGERDKRLVPYIIDSLLDGRIPAIKYPYITRDYMHAKDIAAGFINLLLNNFNGAVNIASGQAITLCDIAKKIALLMNSPVPEYSRTDEGILTPLILADTRRLNNIINFKQKISWEDGLTEIINWRKSLHEKNIHAEKLLTNHKNNIIDSGFRIQDSGFRIQDSGFRSQEAEA